MHRLLFAALWLLFTGINAQLLHQPAKSQTFRFTSRLLPDKPTTPPDVAAPGDSPYWLADITHQGVAAFNRDPSSYKVFRNVKDYGAKGTLCSLSC